MAEGAPSRAESIPNNWQPAPSMGGGGGGMSVDTSIYRQPQQNPFDMVGRAVGIANSVEQNQLLKGQQVQQNIGIDKSKLELAVSQLGQLRDMFAPHLNSANFTSKDASAIGMEAIQQGLATPQQVATELSSFPKDGSAQDRQAWVRNMYVRSLSHEQQISQMLGPVQAYDTGGGLTFVQQPGRPDQPSAQRGAIANTLPAGTPTYDPATRQKGVVTQGQPGSFVSPQPQRPTSRTPYGQPSPQDAQPQVPSQMPPANVRVGPPLNPNKTQDRVSPGGARFVPTEPPLGEGEAARNVGGASGSAFATDLSSAANYNREVFPLTQAIGALEKLGTRGTGPGADALNQIKSFVLTNVPGANFDGIRNDVEAYDKAKKYLTQYVNENGGSAGTNDKLAAAFSGNANTSISNAAAQDVAKSALALRRMRQAQVLAFHESGKPESDYTRFGLTWNRQQDPRAFGVDMMQPDQRKKLLESLKGDERSRFLSSIKAGIDAGVINPSSLASAQGK